MFKSTLLKIIKSKLFLPTALYVVMDIILITFTVFLCIATYQKYQEVKKIELEITDLKVSVDLIKGNKDLVKENVSFYNELLDKMIPNEETYFQVISALDKLEDETGVIIYSYSIDLKQTTENKLSLSLTLGGDTKNVQDMLQRYVYSSGRLITNQKVDLDFTSLENFQFDINMIHLPKAEYILPDVVILEESDIDLLDNIARALK